ncbi:MAG: hypothetical protein GDA35_06760 [Hyphomonadaceae bacterium]|nr:hypothetical protein [Hyphomonadaceae bacterium]
MGLPAVFIAKNQGAKNQGAKNHKGRPMPTHIKRAGGAGSKVSALVQHSFAHQKQRMDHETQRVKCA